MVSFARVSRSSERTSRGSQNRTSRGSRASRASSIAETLTAARAGSDSDGRLSRASSKGRRSGQSDGVSSMGEDHLTTYFCGSCGAKAMTLRQQLSEMPARGTDDFRILEDPAEIVKAIYLQDSNRVKKGSDAKQVTLVCLCGEALACRRPDLDEMYFDDVNLVLTPRKNKSHKGRAEI